MGGKMSEACGTVGKQIASQNDLLVTEHEFREREAVIAGYVKEVARLKEENKRQRDSLRIHDEGG
jgi:cell shape-determining protein MreC